MSDVAAVVRHTDGPRRITKRERRELALYVRGCAELMELRDWTIDLVFARPEGGDDAAETLGLEGVGWNAQVEATPGRKNACLTVDPECVGWPREELRQTVAHELAHLHFAALWHQMRLDLLTPLGQGEYNAFMGSAERNLEYGIDAMADAVAPRLPLIDWP